MSVTSFIAIPSPNDFQAAFGCDCVIDKDLIQTCHFKDRDGAMMTITFSPIDKSFGLSLSKFDVEIIKIYNETLRELVINEDEQEIDVILGDYSSTVIKIIVWPLISLSIVTMSYPA
jgi:hypothetical protein